MGTWGFETFESDDAADWLAGLLEEDDVEVVSHALARVAAAPSDAYVEAPDAVEALCAGEAVAACAGAPSARVPSELVEWCTRHAILATDEMKRLATRAATRVADDSELRELWDETDEADLWLQTVADLVRRLGSIGTPTIPG